MPFDRSRLYVVALMFLFSVANYFDRTIMSIAGPEVMKEFSISPTQMGTVYSAFVLGYALFMMPGGHLVDLLGAHRSLTIMGVCAALFTGITALCGQPWLHSWIGVLPALIAVRFLMGVSTSPLYPSCGRMCANWVSANLLARAQGFIIGGASLGGAISPLLFRALMGNLGWRLAFGVAAVATGGLTLVWVLTTREYPVRAGQPSPTRTPATASSWKSLLTNRNLLLLTAAYGALGYFGYLFYYWIYYYFGEVRHMGYELGARFTTLVFIVAGLMMPLGGWLSDRVAKRYGESFGRRAVSVAGFVLSAALLWLGTVATQNWTTACLMALAMGFASFAEGPFWAMAIRIGGEQVGAACSILNMGSNVAGFLAPVLTPYIASFAGWSAGLYVASFAILLGAVACWFVKLEPASALQNDPYPLSATPS